MPARRRRPFFVVRAARGFGYPFRGIRAVYGDARLRGLAWPPVIFLALALAGATWAAFAFFGDLSAAVWEKPSGLGLVLWYPFQVLFALALVVAVLFLVLVAQAIFTAPWNDALSERVERLRTGHGAPPLSLRLLLKDVLRTVQIELGKLLLYAVVMIPLFVLSLLVPVLGQLLLSILGFVLSALFLALDYMDWPMARRGWAFSRRIGYLGGEFWSAIGFGTGCWMILLVPFLNALFVPAAVAGGTSLFLDLEVERGQAG